MDNFDLNSIDDQDTNLSDVINNPDVWNYQLSRKIESQRWCLGFKQDTYLHSVIDGQLISNFLHQIAPPNIILATESQLNTPSATQSPVLANTSNPNWVEIAEKERLNGVHEGDSSSNPRINEYLSVVGLGANDEIPWCSAFCNWVMEKAGYKGSGSGLARSWLNWGQPSGEAFGAITVFSRGKLGHVGFFLGRKGNQLIILGGNQSNAVRISNYSTTHLLGMRLPGPSDKR